MHERDERTVGEVSELDHLWLARRSDEIAGGAGERPGWPPMLPTLENHALIPLTQGVFAKVDLVDYVTLSQWKWYASYNTYTKSFYAQSDQLPPGSSRAMQRLILGLRRGDARIADHINHDTLDNRRFNLRITTRAGNAQNSKIRYNNLSGLKGVHFCARSGNGKWRAQIQVDGRKVHIGYFMSKEEAHQAYIDAGRRLHGKFTYAN